MPYVSVEITDETLIVFPESLYGAEYRLHPPEPLTFPPLKVAVMFVLGRTVACVFPSVSEIRTHGVSSSLEEGDVDGDDDGLEAGLRLARQPAASAEVSSKTPTNRITSFFIKECIDL